MSMTQAPSLYDRVCEEFRCDHPRERVALTLFTASNGVQHYRRQCLECGETVETVKRSSLDVQDLVGLRQFDRSIAERWRKRWGERYEQLKAQEQARSAFQKARENREWWERYERHLRSPKWMQIQMKVLARCNYKCEGCGRREATLAHHKTYERMGDEMLFDLLGLCQICHAKIHQKEA